jgi:proteasome lid subunit RPN8/RPN11
MAEACSKPEESIDIRLLERQDLPSEAFPGGRNQGFRVYFTHEVHAALWKHGSLDTSVEICGVLVGSWHRDQAGPFVKIVESIRGEGAETKFAEVTFTHQTWAKINSEMDTKFANWSIVGWYHTHPDFGIFLSDRDRFIHEHFFSGPGQVAHVIDPIRRIEGVFAWRDGKPTLCEHFWVGDDLHFGLPGGSEAAGDHGQDRAALRGHGGPPEGHPAPARSSESQPGLIDLLSHPGRLALYGGAFLAGWLVATIASAWGQQRFTESVLANNGVISALRIGLSDELDRVGADLAAIVPPLKAIKAGAGKSEESFAEIQSRLRQAVERTALIKDRYGYTPSQERLLSQLLFEQLRKASRSLSSSSSPQPELPNISGSEPPPSSGGSSPSSAPTASSVPEDGKSKASTSETTKP